MSFIPNLWAQINPNLLHLHYTFSHVQLLNFLFSFSKQQVAEKRSFPEFLEFLLQQTCTKRTCSPFKNKTKLLPKFSPNLKYRSQFFLKTRQKLSKDQHLKNIKIYYAAKLFMYKKCEICFYTRFSKQPQHYFKIGNTKPKTD